MNIKTIKSTIISIIVLLTFITTTVFVQADFYPHAVKGTAYIDGSIAEPGIEIEIHFYEDETFIGTENGTTFTYDGEFNFNIGFKGHEGEKGYFRINDQAPEEEPEPYVEINNDDTYYYIGQLNFSSFADDLIPPSKVTGLTVTDAKDGKLDLSWSPATDNVAVAFYNIYWNQNSYTTPITTVTHPTTTYQHTGLTNGQEYCYKISAVDTSDNQGEKSDAACGIPTASPTPNDPPYTPSSPSPINTATSVNVNAVLSWTGGDPNGDTVTYDVYFGKSTNPAKLNSNQTAATYNPGTMDKNTLYYWRIVAWDDKDATTEGPLWQFTTKANNAPDKPITPEPENNSIDVVLNPVLSIYVLDTDGDSMTVTFKDASDDSIIGTAVNVDSATRAAVTWPGLSFNTTYNWYAVADDGELETQSDVYCFKTIKEEDDDTAPVVFFETPQEGGLYLFGNNIFSGILKTPLIIGNLNIIVNATDNQSGISHVTLSIKGKWQNITQNLTTSPYTYEWSSFGFKTYNITATAYDNAGNSASTSILVKKFL
jgi:hypothetical protein